MCQLPGRSERRGWGRPGSPVGSAWGTGASLCWVRGAEPEAGSHPQEPKSSYLAALSVLVTDDLVTGGRPGKAKVVKASCLSSGSGQ